MLKRIDPKEIDGNVFSRIGEQWMLVTAGTTEKANAMTASWGGLGVLWGAPVATIYIRPQRYTYGLLEAGDTFSLAFLGEEYRKALGLCGSKSGRDMDKLSACGFTLAESEAGAPYIQESELVLVCRKKYWQDIDPAHFLTPDIDEKWYKDKDYHRMYIGEILEAYQKA